MKITRKQIQRFGILVGSLLLLFQFYQAALAFKDNTAEIHLPGLVLLALIFLSYSIFQQIIAWVLIMTSMGIQLPIGRALQNYMLSFLPRYIPGSVWGYISRAEWLLEDYKISYMTTNLGSVLEVGGLLTANILMIGLYASLRIDGIIQIALLISLVLLPPAGCILLRKIGRIRIITRYVFKNQTAKQLENLNIWGWCGSILLITLNWFLYGAACMSIASSLGLRQGAFTLQDWLSYSTLFSVAWLAGFLVIFIPSGLGLREVVLSNLLVTNFNISTNQASALSVLMRLAIVLAEILWIVFGIMAKLRKKTDAILDQENNTPMIR